MILDTFFGRYDDAQLEAKSVRKSYSKEHKIQAAEMVLDGGQSVPEVCEILGIGRWLFAGGLTRYGRRERGKSRLVQRLSPRSNDESRSWKAWFVKRIGISKS
ncbi:hypothetical protein GLGCALEP_01169 [Pseudomonas sp. MM221]|nr:hypothetical protein GLGCALEP_01169 [Pseudomonas sp. MM221]